MAKYVLDERERYEALFDSVEEALSEDRDQEVKDILEESHYADIAEIITDLEADMRIRLFSLLTNEQAANVFSMLDADDFWELYSTLTREQKVSILDLMSDDDIADILGDLPDDVKERMVRLLDAEDAKDLEKLMTYADDTAGGIMTTNFISLQDHMTVAEALEYLRQEAELAETVYYIYVCDKDEKLVGIMSLRELIIARPETLIADIMNTNVIYTSVDTDQEEVARIVSKYDFLILPVIDEQGVLVGIVTVDDVIDIIEEEATEDILKFAGTSEYDFEQYEDEVASSVFYSVKSRLPWLLITICGGVLSSNVVKSFQHVLSFDTAIALFMPLLAGMGGNVGTQSSTITVRTLALRELKLKDTLRLILQESLVGVVVGIICAIIVALVSTFLNGRPILSVVVALAMFANIFTAAIIGVLVPLVFKKVGVDPAVASAPFISTTIDITGLTIYFTLALYFMSRI